MKRLYKAGVVGTSGLVGNELVQLLTRGDLPLQELRLFDSMDQAGEQIDYQGESLLVKPVSADYYRELDLIFFTAHPIVSRDLAEAAAQAGAIVIDASRSFRLQKDVPLVVAEINSGELRKSKEAGLIIASPGPAAIGLSLALRPLERELGLKRVLAVALYGSTSGGRLGFEEHQSQTVAIFNNQEFEVDQFPRQTAFNIFPQVGEFVGESTQEELDIEQEVKKVLSLPKLKISTSCAQVPVFAGISVFVCLETRKSCELSSFREIIGSQPGLKILDEPGQGIYPDILTSLKVDQVLVGRLKPDPLSTSGFQFWLNIDNLRKGSALNMLQIAQKLVEQELL
jgi:aspartate-semialdehyde dehydrogenase